MRKWEGLECGRGGKKQVRSEELGERSEENMRKEVEKIGRNEGKKN